MYFYYYNYNHSLRSALGPQLLLKTAAAKAAAAAAKTLTAKAASMGEWEREREREGMDPGAKLANEKDPLGHQSPSIKQWLDSVNDLDFLYFCTVVLLVVPVPIIYQN